jgi:hypothetical protein
LRYALLLAVLAGAATVAVFPAARHARACTGPGPVENMLYSRVVIEGRVVSVVPNGRPERGSFSTTPHDITFRVDRAYKGATAGETIRVLGFLPTPGIPTMCPQFPADLAGKYVVIGLNPNDQFPGELVADAWVMPFLGDEPRGKEYDQAVRLAEMITDSAASAPQLVIEPPVATCGQPIRFAGHRFPPGEYALRYIYSPRLLGLVTAGADGEFALATNFVHDSCDRNSSSGRLLSVHVIALTGGEGPPVGDFARLLEIASAPIAGAIDRNEPVTTLNVTPNPARCGDTLTIVGNAFLPEELLGVFIGDASAGLVVRTDIAGAFEVRTPIPPGACTGRVFGVRVTQGGYGPLTQFLSIIERQVSIAEGVAPPAATLAPGPPVAGTSAPPTDRKPGFAMPAGLALALLGGGALVTFQAIRRKPR